MGTRASCSIALVPTDKSFYWAGETISGNIVLTVNKSFKVKSMDVNIIGQLIYMATGSTSDSNATTQIVENFYVTRQPLIISPTNGITYKKNGYYLKPNTYKWPFSVRLAKSLPPSLTYTTEHTQRIDYCVVLNLGRSRCRPNICSRVDIMVIPRVLRPPNVWPIEKMTLFWDLYIYGKLLRHYLVIGERYITLELYIENPSQTTITEIIVKLVQRRQLSGNLGKAVIFEQSLPDIKDFQNKHLHDTFQVPVLPSLPLFAPSSYNRDPEKPYQSWFIDYVLKVIIKTKLFFTNVILEFPIMVVNIQRSSEATA